ncbi:endo-1,4-beta-xylanase [Pseudobacteroides cellulosolvens]|uniref:endo-1,4-beta-xylanase n=1 Tax=Pseudobacteroides cellulosolvens TaxID=35825 RepID=UPI0006898CC3|nr:endo-1,4-beta-xylanase [Pseudobacteroides cellulosolvens]
MMSKRRINKCISFTISIIMLLSMLFTFNMSALAVDTQDINLVENGDMENSTNWWHANGGSSLTTVSDVKHSGNSSIKTNGRTNPWNGVAQVLTDNQRENPVAGKKYHGSAWVMFNSETKSNVTFKLSIKRNDGTEDKYDTVAQLDVEKGKWTLIEGDYTLPADSDVSKGVQIYVETNETDTFIDFYADDLSFSVAESAASEKLVALTFDDGPDKNLTPLVLDRLQKYKVPATFMMVGSKIGEDTKDVIQRVLDLGCEIGNHSWSYADMANMTSEEVKKSVTDTTYAIEQYSGTKPLFFRPPNLSISDTMFDAIDMPFVSGVTANDWERSTTAEQRAKAIIDNVKDGSIILLHDVQPLPHPTPEALDIIIPELLSQGYKFVTLSELFNKKGVALNPDDKTMYVTVGVDAPKIEGKDIVNNGDFENGINWWYNRGDASIEVTSDVYSDRSSVLKITGRKDGWHGAAQNLVGNEMGDPIPGNEYTGSAWVMYNSENAPDTMTFRLSVQWNDGTETHWDQVSQLSVSKGVWTKLEGIYTIPSNAVPSEGIHLYAETAEAKPADGATCIDFYLDDVSFKAQGTTEPITYDFDPNAISLRSVWDEYFPIGAAIRPDMTENPVYVEYLKKHYTSLTAENVMKPIEIQPEEGKFTFENADKIVNFAQENKMLVRGHAFVWHSQVPDWLFTDPADSSMPATREKLLERMKTHMETFMTRYKGKIHTYDVVNEVISDTEGLRDSKWKSIIGDMDNDGIADDYIIQAFKYAQEIADKIGDDKVKFCINDYSLESSTKKLDAFYDTVKRILDSGISKDRLVAGFQMHISNYGPSMEQIKSSIEKIASLGVKVQVTELDMSIYKSDTEEKKAATEEILASQAKRFMDLFDLFKKEAQKGIIDSVTLWGTDDGMSWKNDFPREGRTDAALIFNSRLQVKPAFTALTDPDSLPVYKKQINTYNGSPFISINNTDILWSTITPVDVTQVVYGTEGTTASVKTMWDNNSLYILAQVTDKTVSTKDSLEIFIDKDEASMDDNMHFTITPNNSVTNEVYHCFTKKDDNGYLIQAFIPISNFAPKKGDKLEIDFRVKDFNTDNTLSSVVVWNDYKNRLDTDNSGYGFLSLEGAAKLIQVKCGTPVIDGSVDSTWYNVSDNETGVWVSGSSGSTAKFKTLWDKDYLYVLADVSDTKLSKKSPNTYEQDSVEIFVDQNNSKTTAYQTDDYQIRINFDNEVAFDHAKPQGFKSATSKTDTGYIVEAAIPMTAIKLEAGRLLGFDLQINNDNDEDDTGSRDSVSIWCDASGNSWQSLSGLGNIILESEIVSTPTSTPTPVASESTEPTSTPTPVASESTEPTSTPTPVTSESTAPTSTPTPTATSRPYIGSNPNNTTSTPTATPTPTATATPTVTPTATPTAKTSTTPTPTPKASATNIPVSPKPAAGFSDISKHWAKDYISALITKGIISGYTDGTIKPDKNISRAELAVSIMKTLGLKPLDNAKVDFIDAKTIPSWALGYIALAKQSGIIQGNADKTFSPNKECSRQEAITMIMRAFKLGESTKELKFKDVKDIPGWSYKYIAKATESDLIKGYTDNTFKPGKSITRAELFTLLFKCTNTNKNTSKNTDANKK